MTRAIPALAWPAAPERRRYVPALPTLWPGMLSPLAERRPPPFPLGTRRVTPFYFARNAVYHGARLLRLAGAEVLVPAYHHGVEIAALVAAGAVPRFVRVDARMRLDLDDAAARVSAATRALYVIHYAGFPQPMEEVLAFARSRGLLVIEDCALALLSCDGERPLGSAGHAAVFCFYKTIPVPNGGALVLNDPALPDAPRAGEPAPIGSTLSHAAGALLANAALRLGEAGETVRGGIRAAASAARRASGVRPISTGTSTFDPAWVDLGMSGLSARIAQRLDGPAIVATRRRNWFLLLARLRDRAAPVISELPVGVCPLFYPLLCDDKSAVQERLAARGIETVDFWRTGHPLCPAGAFPEVEDLRRRVLELPVHQDLGPEDMAYLARAVREAVR